MSGYSPPRFYGILWIVFLSFGVLKAQNLESRVVTLVNKAKTQIEADRFSDALRFAEEASALVKLPDAAEIRAQGTLPNLKPEVLGQLLFYRGMAYEGLESFAEARNDYLAFLKIMPTNELAQTIRTRIQYIDQQATRYLANLSKKNEAQLARYFNREENAYTIGIIPFMNQTSNPDYNRLGYGISGFLTNVLASLGRMSDKPFTTVERARLNAILTEINIGRFYSDENRIKAPNIGKVLGAEYVITGTVSTRNGRLVVQPILTHVSADTSYVLNEKVASGTNTGLRTLQEMLTFDLADQLQRLTGFRYLPSRAAFADSVSTLLVDDLQRFLSYSQGFEMVIAGDYDAATQILSDANISIANRDRTALEQARNAVLQSYSSLTDLLNQSQSFGGFVGGGGGGGVSNAGTQNKKVIRQFNLGYAANQLGLLSLGDSGIADGDAGVTEPINTNPGDSSTKPPGTVNPSNQPFIKVQVVVPLPKSN